MDILAALIDAKGQGFRHMAPEQVGIYNVRLDRSRHASPRITTQQHAAQDVSLAQEVRTISIENRPLPQCISEWLNRPRK